MILVVNLIISFSAGCATHREAYFRALRIPQAMTICLVIQFVLRPARRPRPYEDLRPLAT